MDRTPGDPQARELVGSAVWSSVRSGRQRGLVVSAEDQAPRGEGKYRDGVQDWVGAGLPTESGVAVA